MKSVFEVIQHKISTVSNEAVDTFKAAAKSNLTDEMWRLGFTSSVSVVDPRRTLNKGEVLRARMISYFGGKVLYMQELKKLEKNYKLTTLPASRFMDSIPAVNQQEIVSFSERLKKEKLNYGTVETDLYHIPITDYFLITAPAECFRKALDPAEMSKEELRTWLDEDPIVWKRIWRFDPRGYGENRNSPTDMVVMVTAWGLEATLINTN